MFLLLAFLVVLATASELDVDERAAVTTDTTYKWKNGNIYYQIVHYNGDDAAQKWLPYLKSFFNVWHENTCIRFIPYNKNNNEHYYSRYLYIYIEPEKPYSCYIANYKWYTQLWLPENCVGRHLMQELSRTIGLSPEHRRTDRDNYVTIADEAKNSDYYKVITQTSTSGLPYDYESIFHRALNDSGYGGRQTVFVRNKHLAEKIATDALPSFYDFKATSKYYDCNKNCGPKPAPNCRYGGYQPGIQIGCRACKCYPGFKGETCEEISTKTKFNQNQHRWGSYLVGKLSKCRVELIQQFVAKYLSEEVEPFLRLSKERADVVGDIAGKRIGKILMGDVQHMPYRSIGGASVGLFANTLIRALKERYFDSTQISGYFAITPGSSLIEAMKKNLYFTLINGARDFKGLSDNVKLKLLDAFGVTFADVIGAELHGPIGFKIAMSGVETAALIKECIENIIYELKSQTSILEKFYDTEFS